MTTPSSATGSRGVSAPRRPTPLGWVLLGAGVLLVTAAIVVPTIAFVRTMSPSGPPPASRSQLARARVGDPVGAVVRLDRRAGVGAFEATFLEPRGSDGYRLTDQRLRIELAADLSVAMGDAGGLRPGAVVEVAGRLSAAGTITVHRATLLTGFVTVGT